MAVVMRDLDNQAVDLRSGVLALLILTRSADFRQGEKAASDQLQAAIEWIGDRLLDQVEIITDTTDRLAAAEIEGSSTQVPA